MLTGNRRHRLLFIALAGMDVAWSLPFALTVLARWSPQPGLGMTPSPAALFIFCWSIILGYMLCGDWLNRRSFGSPWRELAILGLVTATSLLGERLLVFGALPVLDMTWLRDLAQAVFNFTEGVRPALVFFGYNLFLWWRIALLSGRDLAFFGVGLSFRLGMLFALLGNGLLVFMGNRPASEALPLLWIFFACGLTATALARMDDKALTADNSSGALLPWRRFAQLLMMVGATLGLSAALSLAYSPSGFQRLFGRLAPVTDVLGQVALLALYGLLSLFTPLFLWLDALITRLRQQAPPPQPIIPPGGYGEAQPFTFTDLVRDFAPARYCLTILVIVIAIALIWLFFARTIQAMRRNEVEEEHPDELTMNIGGLRRGVGRARSLLALARRFGVGRSLLAAISVKNIYANVGRLARKRGFGRPPAMSPDDYLPLLRQAFPGCDTQLERLTTAYLRVHYGDEPVTPEELDQLKQAYQLLRTMPI
jgi:hypothetical protein